jgi:hypothetical protein
MEEIGFLGVLGFSFSRVAYYLSSSLVLRGDLVAALIWEKGNIASLGIGFWIVWGRLLYATLFPFSFFNNCMQVITGVWLCMFIYVNLFFGCFCGVIGCCDSLEEGRNWCFGI